MSIKADILAAVQTALQRVVLTGVASIVARKHAVAVRESDSFPLLVLSAEKETWLGGGYGRDDWYGYPVLVTLIGEGLLLHDPAFVQTTREAVREALFVTPLPGAPTVWDVDYEAEPDFDEGALRAGLDVSGQRFTYSSRDDGNT